MAGSIDPDQMPSSAASDLGLHCLQRPICPNTKGYYNRCLTGYFILPIFSKCENEKDFHESVPLGQ